MKKFIVASVCIAAVMNVKTYVFMGAEQVGSDSADKTPIVLFEDNFDGDTIDPTKWERCPEQERCNGMDFWDDKMSYLDGKGKLILETRWNSEEGRVHSGAVQTADKFSHGYGYYEASVRFPKAYGMWGAFWMMAGDVINVDGSSKDGIEIDIIESIDNEQNKCNHALHWDGYGKETKSDGKIHKDLNIYDGHFHTFGLWRTEKNYIFYVDGKETWRSSGGGICPLDGYMLLSCESSADMGGGTGKSIAALPAKMEVDYVRVLSTKPPVTADPQKQVPAYDLISEIFRTALGRQTN